MSACRFPMPPVSRRRLLSGLGAAALLPGCAGWVQGGARASRAYRSGGAPGIGIVIFQTTDTDFAFHTAAVIDAPQGRVLYDPGGWWDDGQGQRVADVTHGLSPVREAAYLRRDYFGADPGDWRVHRFDRDLSPAQAARALTLAQEMPPVVFGLCCWGLTSVLSQLEDFADVGVWILPQTLLGHLQARTDLRHSVHLTP